MEYQVTRVRTRQGVLIVTPEAVRLEGPLVRRVRGEIPRGLVTGVHLSSRFHAVPLVLGGLLLAGSVALTLAAASPRFLPWVLAASFWQSAALVLVVTGLFCLLCVPLTWRAVLEVTSSDALIRVHTGFNRRGNLEAAHSALHECPPGVSDLAAPVSTPSGRR